jgi:hypothetical protein
VFPSLQEILVQSFWAHLVLRNAQESGIELVFLGVRNGFGRQGVEFSMLIEAKSRTWPKSTTSTLSRQPGEGDGPEVTAHTDTS